VPASNKGAWSNLVYKEKIVARVVRTRQNVKPVYISVGHKANLEQATMLTLKCCTKYRLPEPTRLAHNLVTAAKQTLN
jgi:deoxyribonuclease V